MCPKVFIANPRCFRETLGAMTRAFYANVRLGLKRGSKIKKIHVLSTCILAIARARWARWPWQKSYGDSLNKLQRQFLAVLFDVKPRPQEDIGVFQERRHAFTQHLAQEMGLWSVEWARSIVSWSDHVARYHDAGSWIPALLGWQDSVWLSIRRALFSSSGISRTRTRVFRGKPERRWEEGLAKARRVIR